ncbi:nSTAND1 domain-containing NTPase [Amycolatopsis sp. NPDC005003]
MPRPERPLHAGDEPLTLFARELRKLRESAGNTPYRRLAQDAHYSATTLSDAAGGKTLPSLAVTLAYVRACGGDPAEWEQRWRQTNALITPPVVTGGTDSAEPRPPYLGLSAFQTTDAELFFGRGALLATLLDRIRHHRLVAVLGASGSGKSSLLHAGMAGTDLRPTVTFTPGSSPLEECALHLAAFAGESAPALLREFTGDPTTLHLRIRQALADHPGDTDLLLVVDQFEELFTLGAGAAERQAFITALAHAATAPRSRVRVVLGVRSDFFAHCARHPELQPALGAGQVLVGPMSPDELREAIVKPAAAAHYTVESALVARLVAESANQPGTLPLVSHALLETWRRRSGMTLTVAGYEQTGGIRDALALTAENVYTGFDEVQRAAARQILLRLVALGEGTEDTKRRITRTELDGTPAVRAVLAALTAARLVTVDHDSVEITHEALITHWPRLREWLAADRELLRIHRQLADDAAVWERLQRDPDTLYRGIRLARTRELADTALTAREHAFLDAAMAAETARQDATRRRTWVLRGLVVVLAALLGVTTMATAAALKANDTVTAQRDTVLARQAADEAVTLRATRPALAAQVALAAYRLRPTQHDRDALISAVAIPLEHVQEIDALAFRPDGRLLATAAADHRVRLWNLADPAHPALLVVIAGHDDAVHAVAFDPGGTVLATAGRDRTVRLWDLRDAAHPVQLALLTGHRDTIYSLAYAPDGRTLATASYDHTVRLWDVRVPARPVELPTLTTHVRNVKAVAFSPDSRLLASGGDDRTVRLWDVSEPSRPVERSVLNGHSDLVVTVAFSRDGRFVASGGDDHTVRLWTVTDPAPPAVLPGHTDVVSSVAFSPDRRLLASAGYDRSVRLWDIGKPGSAVLATLTGHTGAVEAVSFSPDGHLLATAGDDHTALLWEIDLDRAAARACGIAHPTITRQEWDTFFPGVGYRPPC